LTASARRDIVFLLADKGMEQVVTGFLTRKRCHLSLGCAAFDFDPRRDIIVSPTKDSGMLKYARGLLKSYEATHRRAVVILDDAWQGSPGPVVLRERLSAALSEGWKELAVIVIEPELEAWLMSENAHLPRIFRCPENYRQLLAAAGLWPVNTPKPPDPKAALDHLRQHYKARASNAEFGKLAAATSVRHCQDLAFIQLRDQLRTWFPEKS
jgi:hypothetical protein